jgi:dihydroorotate dehydrogenase (NAD+) catalytic subunit
MLNSVGLQGPGVAAWLDDELPALNDRGARVVASIWGQHVDDYARAAELLVGAPGVVAVEVNVSCPNVDDRSRMFAHSTRATAEAVAATEACGLPRWAKLSPNVHDLLDVAGAALEAGAEALVLVNTVLGMAVDVRRRAYALGSGPGGGGLSGPAIRPIALRAVHDCRAAFGGAGIVGVGGVARGVDAVAMLMAGADAVEVGTATFRDPRAPAKVLSGLARWCRWQGVESARSLVGAVHGAVGGDRAVPPGAVMSGHGHRFAPTGPAARGDHDDS